MGIVGVAIVWSSVSSLGCATLVAPRSRTNVLHEVSTKVRVHGEDLTLHRAWPAVPVTAATPIVLYASGDGGWFGSAVTMFRTIAASGVPTVGFSTKAFLAIERRWSRPLTVAHVVEGYQRIIDSVRSELGVAADTPILLTGWSRGAALGVIVASSHAVDPAVIGVVAIGLAADEQLDVEGDTDDDIEPGASAQSSQNLSLDMYPLIARIAPRRSVVIQATHDNYLPAARARSLFGTDSAVKRLVEINARNHRFGGGEDAFAAALREAVGWASSR
jgi:hypothetical protein